jgi:hypothetical protein
MNWAERKVLGNVLDAGFTLILWAFAVWMLAMVFA